jgi:hypothetical protein
MTKQDKITAIIGDLKENLFESLEYLLQLSEEALNNRSEEEINSQYEESFCLWDDEGDE